MVADPELRARGLRHQQRGQLPVRKRAHRAARCPARGRCRPRADDAGNRMLRAHRHGAIDRARRQGRMRGGPDAAAVLLQGRVRGRPLSHLLGSYRACGRLTPADLSLPHTPGRRGRYQAGAGRAPDEAVPDGDRGNEGQLGRLEQFQDDARCFCQVGLRRVCRKRILPPCQHEERRRRLHFGHRQRQSRGDRQALSRVARRQRGRAAAGARRGAQDRRAVRDDSCAQGSGRPLHQ